MEDSHEDGGGQKQIGHDPREAGRLVAWADVLHGANLAEATIDRVLARGRPLELRGPSYRSRPFEAPPLERLEGAARLSGKERPEFPEPTPAHSSGPSPPACSRRSTSGHRGSRRSIAALPFCHVTLTTRTPEAEAFLQPPRTLGERLIRRRRDLDLTQRQVADRLQVCAATYASWESGE